MKSHFDTHTSKHPGNDSNYNLRQCIHCNVTFKSNRALDNHVVNLHPNFAEFVRRRVFQCTKCVYKTTYKTNFDRHVLVHSNSA
ncbi:unnamed protein product [Callosobruchus maculatus]|uniref:C2H2-type domain-containing protein n=1 Tax=Callosobruchus maculatus TaxID=64391 RepID=A0A653BLW1_CALMS|nr:unnamed protein product [Callosobruchus maculatus]